MIDEEEKANKRFHRSQESVALETFHFMTHGSLIFLLVERKEFGRWDSLGKKKELEHKVVITRYKFLDSTHLKGGVWFKGEMAAAGLMVLSVLTVHQSDEIRSYKK